MPLVWDPNVLPPLPTADAQYQNQDNVIRTKMEDGTEKVRLGSTKTRRFFTCTMEMTGAQLAAFEGLLDDGGRTEPVEWIDPVTRDAILVRIQTTAPEWKLYIAAPDPLKARWRASMRFENLGPAPSV